MTTIKTTCSSCGDVELRAEDLLLELSRESGTGHYEFTCPYCEAVRRRPATERVAAILLASGIRHKVVDDPVSETDIAEFVAQLDDWLEDITTG